MEGYRIIPLMKGKLMSLIKQIVCSFWKDVFIPVIILWLELPKMAASGMALLMSQENLSTSLSVT